MEIEAWFTACHKIQGDSMTEHRRKYFAPDLYPHLTKRGITPEKINGRPAVRVKHAAAENIAEINKRLFSFSPGDTINLSSYKSAHVQKKAKTVSDRTKEL